MVWMPEAVFQFLVMVHAFVNIRTVLSGCISAFYCSLFFSTAKCEIKYIQLEVAYAIIKKRVKVKGELLMESFSILNVFHLEDFGFQV